MRVISGTLKGYKLFAPKSTVRPTSDRVKEALFNMIEDVEGEKVLDLFCGSGALGIEALSRGAELAIFVDQSHGSIGFTKKNLSNTHLEEKAHVYKSPVKKFLKKYKKHIFGLIFLDPPYKINLLDVKEIFELIFANQLADKSSIIVYEHSSRTNAMSFDEFDLVKSKIYGDTAVSFYKLKGNGS